MTSIIPSLTIHSNTCSSTSRTCILACSNENTHVIHYLSIRRKTFTSKPSSQFKTTNHPRSSVMIYWNKYLPQSIWSADAQTVAYSRIIIIIISTSSLLKQIILSCPPNTEIALSASIRILIQCFTTYSKKNHAVGSGLVTSQSVRHFNVFRYLIYSV